MKRLPYAVIGHPIAHSLSPRIHRAWLRLHHIPARYEAWDIEPRRLEDFLRQGAFQGLNITQPHKESVYRYLAKKGGGGGEGALDEMAAKLKAVNLIVKKDETLQGRNVDAEGFCEALRHKAPSWRPPETPVVLIGAGGAARGVLAGLARWGQRRFRLLARRQEQAERMAEEMLSLRADMAIETPPWKNRGEALRDASLLVNGSSGGMIGREILDLKLSALPSSAIVMDLVYRPPETPLLKEARGRGLLAIDGLPMLLCQAALSFETWFGIKPDITEETRRALERAAAEVKAT